jgi:hypothetical protein
MKTEVNESKVTALYDALVAAGIVEDLRTAGANLDKADRQFFKMAGKFWKVGFRSNMLVGSERSKEHVMAVRRAIFYSWPEEHQRVLLVTGSAVSDLDDTERGIRDRRLANYGTYTSLVAKHLRKMEDPTLRGKGNGKKADAPTEPVDPIVWIQDLINKATQIVDVGDVDRFQNAGLEMIALLRKHRK